MFIASRHDDTVTTLFDPITLRGRTVRNRIWMSPMCMYSATDGLPNEWHLVHLGARAVGGVGAIIAEATAVLPEGRISPSDTGLWNDAQTAAWTPIVQFQQHHGALAGIQLAHAGRKAGVFAPGTGSGSVPRDQGGWDTVGPTGEAFGPLTSPRAMTQHDIDLVINAFAAATHRAAAAGFDIVEIHAAHGYLLHQFLSPISNTRTDAYGGTFDNRVRFLLRVTDAVRDAWPEDRPLLVRLSATDWFEGGWSADDTVAISRLLRDRGVDLIDLSSGGTVLTADIPVGPGYQVPFAARVHREASVPSGAVGLITQPAQADAIVREGQADVVFLGRELLRDPQWPLRAAHALGVSVDWPRQYDRGRFA